MNVIKPRLKQINKYTLWDKAYISLKSALLAGKYAPGERIISAIIEFMGI